MTKVQNNFAYSLTLALCFMGISLSTQAHNHGGDADVAKQPNKMEHRMHERHKKMEDFMLAKVDTNQDGNIDENEFMTNAKERFDLMDANGDGVVTPEERQEASRAMREKHREAMKAAKEAYKEAKE